MQFSAKSLIGVALREGFDMSRKAPGEIAFKVSNLKDKHIQFLIRDVSKKTGVPEDEILDAISKDISQIEEFKKYSPILYNTMAKNAVETAAFKLIEHSTIANNVQFQVPIFMKLCRMIEVEHKQFFPLRAPGEANYIFHIDPILVPDSKPEKARFNSVDTAAASADGDFIFNTTFMQKLIDWAVIEKLQPKGKKYVSNGGTIPDAYSYIEFLIVHELLHYTFGDFATGKRLKQYDHKIHNWASDFRSNYMLVKNGYDQLPIGLFSDDINYDRQGSYDAMVKLVSDELKKLPKPLQDAFSDAAELDDHPSDPDDNDEQNDNNEEYVPKVGDVVKNNITGKLGKITVVNNDGSIEVTPVEATAQ